MRQLSRIGLGVSVLLALTGCDTLARSQGKFIIAGAFGESVLGKADFPTSGLLWYTPEMGENRQSQPLVKIGYRSPWTGKLVNKSGLGDNWDKQSYYMVLDVSAVVQNPRLGARAGDTQDYQNRLAALAELLLIAADWNGEVYWRHLTTFLDTNRSISAASRAALGGGIAATFVSPVVGASLSAAALVTETFITDYTASFNSEAYPALRKATATYRSLKRAEMFERIKRADAVDNQLHDVLQLAYDYAFSYSIRGSLDAVGQQERELNAMLRTGESPWRDIFEKSDSAAAEQRSEREDTRRLEDPAVTDEEKALIRQRINRRQEMKELDEKLAFERKRKEVADAKVEADRAEEAAGSRAPASTEPSVPASPAEPAPPNGSPSSERQ